MRFLLTAVSKACASASMPLHAATRGGWERVSNGSRMAMRGAALGSPQAIFWRVFTSAIRAKD